MCSSEFSLTPQILGKLWAPMEYPPTVCLLKLELHSCILFLTSSESNWYVSSPAPLKLRLCIRTKNILCNCKFISSGLWNAPHISANSVTRPEGVKSLVSNSLMAARSKMRINGWIEQHCWFCSWNLKTEIVQRQGGTESYHKTLNQHSLLDLRR